MGAVANDGPRVLRARASVCRFAPPAKYRATAPPVRHLAPRADCDCRQAQITCAAPPEPDVCNHSPCGSSVQVWTSPVVRRPPPAARSSVHGLFRRSWLGTVLTSARRG